MITLSEAAAKVERFVSPPPHSKKRQKCISYDNAM
jgi:hypothetical protein